ncbi:UNVERIFIED_CONTAM: hypothetical protein HDU68_003526 [Siphonaria sp. JEL0065]|nr:hypothetical protein HDU68_003526 [Siphonaria sp. JEL0065]
MHLFTDLAYISIRGEHAVSHKRFIDRVEYYEGSVSNVCFETAGLGITDRDVELKFNIGNNHVSIDIWKNEIEVAKMFYKALLALSHEQAKNRELLKLSLDALPRYIPSSGQPPQYGEPGKEGPSGQSIGQANGFAQAQSVISTAQDLQSQLIPRSYRSVFEHYLRF